MKQLLLAAVLLISIASLSAQEQISIKNPEVCHGRDGYLKCYNDGYFKLYFDNGNFRHLTTTDSNFYYSDTDKTISFLASKGPGSTSKLVQLSLLPHSILFKEGTKTLEITSLQQLPTSLNEFPVQSYSSGGFTRGFIFHSGEKNITLEMSTWGKRWSWNIIVKETALSFLLSYNSHRRNRVYNILIQDDSLRFGTSISMTSRSLKKLWMLRSWYAEVVEKNGRSIIRQVPLDNAYRYEYRKNGRLKIKETTGLVKDCECR